MFGKRHEWKSWGERALMRSASKGAAYHLGFVWAWKGQMWTLRRSRYFFSLTCKCPWVRAVKDQFCRIGLDSLPTNLGADLSLQSAFSEVLFAFQWLLILPQKTSITWGLFSGGMVSRCWPQSGWPLFPWDCVYFLVQVCLELLP